MSREENVLNYYVLCNRLKNIIRTGWKIWNVKKDRLESIAEHIFGVQMLAIAMNYEYQYDIDIMKVIYMLAIHEIGETIIGDITLFDKNVNNKKEMEHKAIHEIFQGLLNGEQIEKLFLEFDEHKTKEALFAYQCDKFECDLQCKLYDEENCVDLNNQQGNKIMDNKIVKELINNNSSWSTIWLKFGQEMYPYDEHFTDVSNYAINNNIAKIKRK